MSITITLKKKALFFFFLSSFICFSVEYLSAQTVRGTVVSENPTDTIVGASVVVRDSDPLIGTLTDKTQSFNLQVPAGRHTLIVSCIGYESRAIEVLATLGRETVLSVVLSPSDTKLGEVVVKAPYNKRDTRSKLTLAGGRSFSVDETYRFASSLGDPARMVRSFAGVMPVNDSRNDIIIRGNSPQGLQWILDGIEINNPNHFNTGVGMTGGQVSYLNTNLLTNSDFIMSAWPAPYGNALSGVFDLRMRRGNSQRHEFWGQMGFGGMEAGAEGYFSRKSESSYLVSYRYSIPDIMHFLGVRMSVVPRYQDFTAKLHFDLSPRHKLDVLGLWSKSHIDFSTSEVGKEYTQIDLEKMGFFQQVILDSRALIGGVTHTWEMGKGLSLKTLFSFVRSDTRMETDTMSLSIPEAERAWEMLWLEQAVENKWSLYTQLRWNPSRKGLLVSGLKADLFDVRYWEQESDLNTSQKVKQLVDEQAYFGLIRGYSQYRHNFDSRWSGTLGLHLMGLTINGQFSIEPRLGLRFRPHRSHTLGFAGGLYSRILPGSFYFIRHYTDQGEEYRNKKLDFTRALQADIYYDWAFASDWHAKIEAYYQYLYSVPVENDPTTIWTLLEIGGAGQNYIERQSNLINKGKGLNYGVELTVEKFSGKGYYLLFNASLYRSLYNTGFNDEWYSTVFDGKYMINLTGGYEWQLNSRLALFADCKASYAGGFRYTPIDSELFKQTHMLVLDKGRVNAMKVPDYLRADLKLGCRFAYKSITQEFALDLQNVLNRKNVMSVIWNPSNGLQETVYTQGIAPMVTYKILFSVK